MTVGFPLLLIPLAICNIVVFLMPDVAFNATLATLSMPSGGKWAISVSDVLLALGILLLLLEVIKAARPGAKYVTDHLLSLLVFAGAVAEFTLLPQFATSTFFLLAALALVDFLGGIALRSRTVRTAPAPAAVKPLRQDPGVSEPAPEPTPAVPTATAVAEAVLLDRSEPSSTPPVAAPIDASPRIASPDLQPGPGTNPNQLR